MSMCKKFSIFLVACFISLFFFNNSASATDYYVTTVGNYDYYFQDKWTHLKWRQYSKNSLEMKQVWAKAKNRSNGNITEVMFRYFRDPKGIYGRYISVTEGGRILRQDFIANDSFLAQFYNLMEETKQRVDKEYQQNENRAANFKALCQREQKEVNRVYDLIDKRKYAEAKQVARNSINRLPKYSQGYIAYAMACMEENKNYEAAIDVLTEGINNKAKEPSKSLKNIDATLYYYRAVFNLRSNNTQSARIDFYNVVDLHQGGQEEADAKKMISALAPRI